MLARQDNGCGMSHEQLPMLMGRGRARPTPPSCLRARRCSRGKNPAGWVRPHAVFTGTKYSVRQQRGRFGIGAKMVRCRADLAVA